MAHLYIVGNAVPNGCTRRWYAHHDRWSMVANHAAQCWCRECFFLTQNLALAREVEQILIRQHPVNFAKIDLVSRAAYAINDMPEHFYARLPRTGTVTHVYVRDSFPSMTYVRLEPDRPSDICLPLDRFVDIFARKESVRQPQMMLDLWQRTRLLRQKLPEDICDRVFITGTQQHNDQS